MKSIYIFFALSLVSIFSSIPVSAGVVLGQTRLIYQSNNKSAELNLKNTESGQSFLIQSWVTNFKDTDKTAVPFVVIPPLFRLDSNKDGVIRVKNINSDLPKDRESIFWLNVRSIAAVDPEVHSELQISLSSKIKLIYRPEELPLSLDDAVQKVKVVKNGVSSVEFENPTPYYMNFYNIKIDGIDISMPGVLSPFSNKIVEIKPGSKLVTWQLINDFGGVTDELKSSI